MSSQILPDVLPRIVSTCELLQSCSCVCKEWYDRLVVLRDQCKLTLPEREGCLIKKVIKSRLIVQENGGRSTYKLEFYIGLKRVGFIVLRPYRELCKMDVMVLHYTRDESDEYVLLIKKRLFEGLTILGSFTWCFDCNLLEKSKTSAVIEAYEETFKNGKSIERMDLYSWPRIFFIREYEGIWTECDDE